MTEWRDVPNRAGYEVSSDGEVRTKSGRTLKAWPNADGYALVRMSNPRTVERVHRLVAKAFVANPDGLPFVNHINNIRADNRAGNLEWCTQAENIAHADRQGRMQRDYWTDKRSPNAALTNEQVAEIRRAYAAGGISHQGLATRFGVSKRAIGRCLNRETYGDV